MTYPLSKTYKHRTGNTSLRSALANESSLRANVDSLAAIKDIAVHGEMENELGQKTLINLRALTFVATLYLPASLLSVWLLLPCYMLFKGTILTREKGIFSSQLISVKSDHFVVFSEFWKFVVVLIPMVVMTFVMVAALPLRRRMRIMVF